MERSPATPGVTYLHESATAISALTPNEQFRATKTPPLWAVAVSMVAAGLEPHESLVANTDYYSPQTAVGYINDPNASLIARLNMVNNMRVLFAMEAPELFEILVQVDAFQDRGWGYVTLANNDNESDDRRLVDTADLEASHATVGAYREVAYALADREGIDHSLIDWDGELDPESEEVEPLEFDCLPLAGIALTSYVREFSTREGGHLSPTLRLILPIAHELDAALLEIATKRNTPEAYMQFVLGPDLVGKRAELLSLDTEAAAKFDEQLPRLFIAAEKLSKGYPTELQAGVCSAFLEKTIACVYGYVAHVKHGYHTRGHVTIGEDYQLPFDADGDEPFKLMDRLIDVIENDYELTANPATAVTRSIADPLAAGFQVYRFTGTVDGNICQSVTQVRPWPSHSFDNKLEFGRNGEGVEGTWSKVMKERPGYLPLARNASVLDDTISIRIDREGLDPQMVRTAKENDRDPTRKVGTLALDIGSVLGLPNNFGVQVGRFLASCDAMRTQKISAQRTSLNHAVNYFSPSYDAEFAAILSRHILQYENRADKVDVDAFALMIHSLRR